MYTITLGVKCRKESKVLDEQMLERLQATKKLYTELTMEDKSLMILVES